MKLILFFVAFAVVSSVNCDESRPKVLSDSYLDAYKESHHEAQVLGGKNDRDYQVGQDHGYPDAIYNQPSQEYGPPHQEYGPPKQEYGPPKPAYGPPSHR